MAALASMASCSNPPEIDRIKINAAKQMIAKYGVLHILDEPYPGILERPHR